MAKAQKHVERRVIEDVTIVMKLSEEEARTLAAVLSLVDGDRRKSPREHTVAILNALREARGWDSPFQLRDDLTLAVPGHPASLASGAITFRDYPKGA